MLGQPNTLLIPREYEDEFQRNRKMSRQKQKQDKRWWKCDKRDECQHEGREGIRETEKTKFWQGEWRSQEQQVWLAAGKSIWGYHGPLEARQVIQAVIDSVLTLRHRSSSQKHLLYNGCLRCITHVFKDSSNMQPMWQCVSRESTDFHQHWGSTVTGGRGALTDIINKTACIGHTLSHGGLLVGVKKEII